MSVSYLITQLQYKQMKASEALKVLVRDCENKVHHCAWSHPNELDEHLKEVRDVLEACQGRVEELEGELGDLMASHGGYSREGR